MAAKEVAALCVELGHAALAVLAVDDAEAEVIRSLSALAGHC